MTTKLSKVGNSFSVRIPKETLKKVGFSSDDELELIEKGDMILITKKIPHHSTWTFPGSTELTDEDREWLDADFAVDLDD